MLGVPHFFFFFNESLPFLILSIILKQNLDVGSFHGYFSYAIHKGSNWYMDRGERDLEVAFFLRLILPENPRNAMVCDAPYLRNEFGDPQFFFTFCI